MRIKIRKPFVIHAFAITKGNSVGEPPGNRTRDTMLKRIQKENIKMITIGEIYSVIRFITRSGTFITYVLSGTSALSLKKAIRDVDEDIYGILLSRKTYLQKICVK